MTARWSRREMLVSAALGVGVAGGFSSSARASPTRGDREPFGYCFNTATIRGQKLPLDQEVEIAAKAGYRAIEPWVQKIDEYAKAGGSLADLKKRIADLGLSVESAIGFPDWISDDDAKRAAGLEQMKRDMDLVAQIGGKRIAAPPVGAYNVAGMDLLKVAQRYRTILELGRQTGVVPQLELWGGSKTLRRLGEVAFVLVEAAHPDACAVLDAFHIYRGGSDFSGLRHFNGQRMHVFHMNDYPADPPREKISDQYRVFPGDGVAPLVQVLRDLHASGFRGMLSLELFNPTYFKQDPLEVARTGLAKVQAVVAKAIG
ncbi:MAG: sugar phosphate isomerase/epimerase [Thermoguttaceae bacterium]|jgi:sugar phosphate isomerase/epimerase|nr:sugar phosphate isomerase/epimerase [Thermoguttaceae bacterium]